MSIIRIFVLSFAAVFSSVTVLLNLSLDERAARGSRYFQDVQSALPEIPITSSIYVVERFIRRVKDALCQKTYTTNTFP